MKSTALISLTLITLAAGHGFISKPRMRGAIKTQRAVGSLADEEVVGQRGWSYCPHCLNGGGTKRLQSIAGNMANGNFIDFAPMKGAFRNGVSLCGDMDGSSDFSATGRFGAPDSMPTVASYTAGSVASFEFDITTPHGGFFDFFLCDTSDTGDISRASFKNGRCHALKRASNPICDSGTDSRCGPIDENFPTRWYHPCRISDALDQDFIVGGGADTMLYHIPNVSMEKAVIQAYWQSSNNCSPNGLREYFESGVWGAIGNCEGDGGTVGGFRADHTGTCTTQKGKFPEEFFNCADVEIVGGGSGNTEASGGDSGSDVENVEGGSGNTETSGGASGSDVENVEGGSGNTETSGGDSGSDVEIVEGGSVNTETSGSDGGETGYPESSLQSFSVNSNDENAYKANGGEKEVLSDSGSNSDDQQGRKSYRDSSSGQKLSQNENQHDNQARDQGHDQSQSQNQNNYDQQQQQAPADKPEAASQSGPGFEMRPGCMPVFDESRTDDANYMSYWVQVQNYCKA